MCKCVGASTDANVENKEAFRKCVIESICAHYLNNGTVRDCRCDYHCKVCSNAAS